MRTTSPTEERFLVLASVGQDAALAVRTLARGGIVARPCADAAELCREAAAGAGGLLMTQETLVPEAVERLLAMLGNQPPWADLPLIVLVSGGEDTPASARLAAAFGESANVSFLERPVRSQTLIGAARVALRARRRQYELRDLWIAHARVEDAERRERLRAEDAVRARDDFLASVAHDLKNPLGAIRAQAQLTRRRIRRGAIDPAQLDDSLRSIESVTNKAVTLVDDLVDNARLQSGELLQLDRTEIDLVDLVRRCVEEYRITTQRHELRVCADAPSLVGAWDGRRLERVLANLLTNAIKFSPDGGVITVTVSRQDDVHAAWAVLSVQDRGIGIPEHEQRLIFERFRRGTNAAGITGTGLGLAGAKQIVEQHGGTIAVRSREGAGSTFTIRLPLGRVPDPMSKAVAGS